MFAINGRHFTKITLVFIAANRASSSKTTIFCSKKGGCSNDRNGDARLRLVWANVDRQHYPARDGRNCHSSSANQIIPNRKCQHSKP